MTRRAGFDGKQLMPLYRRGTLLGLVTGPSPGVQPTLFGAPRPAVGATRSTAAQRPSRVDVPGPPLGTSKEPISREPLLAACFDVLAGSIKQEVASRGAVSQELAELIRNDVHELGPTAQPGSSYPRRSDPLSA